MTLRTRNVETNVGHSNTFIAYEVEYRGTSYTIMFFIGHFSGSFNYVIWKTHGGKNVREETEFRPDVGRDLASMARSFVVKAVREAAQ